MKILFKILLGFTLTLTLVGCPSDDTATIEIRDRKIVYEENILSIEDYLKKNYLTLDANNNATVTKIPDGGTQTPIWNNPNLQSITVKNDSRVTVKTDGRIDDDVDYKLYYIRLNEGGGATPTSVDSTLVAYKGWNLDNVVFDQNNQGVWFSFPESASSSISGFRQILKTVKTAETTTAGTDGNVNRQNFGNVIVFIPSGLAYFSGGSLNIGQYQSICFQIKLFDRRERDHDGDRVKSKYEDHNNNNDYFDDDTDGDMLPDFFDLDDDGDGKLTKLEIRSNSTTPYTYYDFLSIPNCLNTSKKLHLAKECK